MISDGENNVAQNKCNKWVKYKNVLPTHINVNKGSSAIKHCTEIHLHEVDMTRIQIQDWWKLIML